MREQIIALAAVAESWSPQQVLEWAFKRFANRVAISSAFGLEGMVIIDMASRLRKDFRLFTVDTEFLFPQTYHLMEKIEERYGITIERSYPLLSPEVQERLHGPALWARDPDECCKLRKVEPLGRKLRELDAWISSIRREQTLARSAARKLEWDAKFALIKINPLADWTLKQ
ncbi:MAG: phosphoadenylyl-sulfate reductase, partial [Acidobacteria bacterium]|nr:phosphoadenylyl-sulfate reductase [Acidobacteriota bacterium]